VRTNRGRMSATVTLSREAEDRSGDIVVLKGLRTDGHRKNPVALLNHRKEHVVGYFQDPLGAYTVKTVGDKLVGEVYFCQDSQLGLDTFRAVEARILRGTSIGFLPVVGRVEKRHQRGTVYHESDLIEGTITPIGDNEDAIVEAVHKTFGKKPPVPELAALLPSMGGRPKVVTSGWAYVPVATDPTVWDGAVAKAATYKTAPAQEVEPQYRSGVYYTCPHCECEMPPDSIYREPDGATRHGPCRGAVVLKPATSADADPVVMRPVEGAGVHGTIATGNPVPKTLAEHITKRLTALRSKAMAPRPTDDTKNAGAGDEFAPVDDLGAGADPAAADPNADHKAVVDESVGNVLASIYDKFTAGSVDLKEAVKLFKDCLQHHGNVASLGGSDLDADGLEDDDEDGDDDGDGDSDSEFGDSFDDDSDSDSDSLPDLEDKTKKKAEKAVADIWLKQYVPTLEKLADGLDHILAARHPKGRTVQKFVGTLREQMKELPAMPANPSLVAKALADVDSPWAEWEAAFVAKNGTH
jgi:hypothetical protein